MSKRIDEAEPRKKIGHKSRRLPGLPPPGSQLTIPVNPAELSAPTLGPICPQCQTQNHLDASRCVSCGLPRFSGLAQPRSTQRLRDIAAQIKADWRPVYFGAEPYVKAMGELDSLDQLYGADTAVSVVGYFLANASSWRGAIARRVKAELKTMIEDYEKSGGMQTARPGTQPCPFNNVLWGACKKPGTPFCAEHSVLKCPRCKEQAIYACSHARGTIMCGKPICATCSCEH